MIPTQEKGGVRVGITVNLALLLSIVAGIVKGTQWVERIDTRMASIEDALSAAAQDRWHGSDTVTYYNLAQLAVNAWARENNLTPFSLPDPRSITE